MFKGIVHFDWNCVATYGPAAKVQIFKQICSSNRNSTQLLYYSVLDINDFRSVVCQKQWIGDFMFFDCISYSVFYTVAEMAFRAGETGSHIPESEFRGPAG